MKGVYALPPGADFARDLVAGLISRFKDQPPEALAQVTLYLNSARTLWAVRAAFDATGPRLLPKMRLIADLGGGAAVSPLSRMLDLAALIEGLAAAQPGMIAGQPVPSLARSLAALMAEMQLEGCSPDALEAIDTGQHAAHWQRALGFLRIAAHAYLTPDPIDREARQRSAAETLAANWLAGRDLPTGPVVVAGSTGSHGATRLFMTAVARLAQSAVVLPGFDFDQPEAIWQKLLDSRGDEHPQARFAPLIAEFGIPRLWADTRTDLARGRLVSLALRPAPVTDQWVDEGPTLGDLVPATEGLSLIEAEQPQAEADAIAVAIRDAAERGEPVTLITADRGLARRVAATLDRWRIIPDDSAGQPLSLRPVGLFLRALVGLNGQALAVDGLLTLLKHPLTAVVAERGEHLRMARDLELHLRAYGPAFPDADFLKGWGRERADRQEWAGWLAEVLARITPLAGDHAARPVADRLAELCDLAEALARGPQANGGPGATPAALPENRGEAPVTAPGPVGDQDGTLAPWQGEDGRLARAVMAGIAAAARPQHQMGARDFADLVTGQLDAQALRAEPGAHPLVRFRGPREARTDAVGLVILGGLNEGGWPPGPAPDPWLSRTMRLQAGLTLPERLIGLAAHDFQQGLAARQVIITRARRDAEAETVPSRWLSRLVNLLGGLPLQQGPAALARMRARGDRWLMLSAQLAVPRPELVAENPPARRPSPVPPKNAIEEISVTQVGGLIRDPYGIYAQKILGLRPLAALHPRPDDPRQRGVWLHLVAEQITRAIGQIGPDPAALEAHFRAVGQQILTRLVPWPAERAFLAARLDAIAGQIAADDAARLRVQQPVVIEAAGGAVLPQSGVRLTARPDRLDRTDDGRVWVFDYKSGPPPTDRQIAAFDKQLPLTAALVARGAFAGLGRVGLSGAAYIRLGGDGRTAIRDVSDDMADEAWSRLDGLLTEYQQGKRGFTALRAIERRDRLGDYAHLARYGEWALSDAPLQEWVGENGDG